MNDGYRVLQPEGGALGVFARLLLFSLSTVLSLADAVAGDAITSHRGVRSGRGDSHGPT